MYEYYGIRPEVCSETSQTSAKQVIAKIAIGVKSLTIFFKKLHLRCLTGFRIHLCRQVGSTSARY